MNIAIVGFAIGLLYGGVIKFYDIGRMRMAGYHKEAQRE